MKVEETDSVAEIDLNTRCIKDSIRTPINTVPYEGWWVNVGTTDRIAGIDLKTKRIEDGAILYTISTVTERMKDGWWESDYGATVFTHLVVLANLNEVRHTKGLRAQEAERPRYT
jgi:hypothetical protein